MFIVRTPRYRLCDMFGIPIYIDISFVVLLVVFAVTSHSFSYGLSEALVLAISVILHELGHSSAARLFGYKTHDITISLIGGCASLIAMPRKAWQELVTALAGPLVSFALGGGALSVLWYVPIENIWLRDQLFYMMWLNFILGAFNLLPGFPMDGGRIFRSVLRAFLSRTRATFVAMWVGRAFAILLGLWGLHAVLTGAPWGFVRIFIAWMIWKEGYREYLQARMESNWEYQDFRARVSPPPYGGDGDECDVTRRK